MQFVKYRVSIHIQTEITNMEELKYLILTNLESLKQYLIILGKKMKNERGEHLLQH